MKFLIDQHREWLRKMNLLGSERFVYMGGGSGGEVHTEGQESGARQPEAAPTQPKTPNQIRTEMEAARDKLQKKYEQGGLSSDEQRALDQYKSKIDKTTEEYKKKLEAIASPDASAAQALEAPVNELIREIEKSAESITSEEVIGRLTREELGDVIGGLETYIGERLFNPVYNDRPENKGRFERWKNDMGALAPQFQQGKISPQQLIDGMVGIAQRLDPEGNHDFNSLIRAAFETSLAQQEQLRKEGNVVSSAETTRLYEKVQGRENPEEKEKTEFISKNLEVLASRLGDALGVKLDASNPELTAVLERALATIDKGKLEASLKGQLDLNQEDAQEIRNIVLAELRPNPNERVEPGERDLVENIGEDEKFKLPNTDMLDNNTELNRLIATKHKIEAGKEKGQYLIDGKELTPDNITTLIPELKDVVGVINMDAELLKKLEGDAGNSLKARETMEQMANVLQQAEGPKKLGALESLTALVQLFMSLKKAIESGDWQTLQDTMQDFNEGKNPAESMKQSRAAYEKALKGKTDLSQLLSAYLDPRGKEADALLAPEGTPEDQKSALTRYRAEARPAIEEGVRSGMELGKINSITKEGERTIVDAEKNGARISVELYKVGNRQVAEVRQYNKTLMDANGKPTGEKGKAEKGTIIQNADAARDVTMADIAKGLASTVVAQPTGGSEGSVEAPVADLFKLTDKTTPQERMAAIKAAGKVKEFQADYKMANPKNAATWELQWMINKKIPKPEPVPAKTAKKVV